MSDEPKLVTIGDPWDAIERGIEIVKRERVDPLGITPESPRLRELGRRLSPATIAAVGVHGMPLWQREHLNRQIRDAMRPMVAAFRDVQEATRRTMQALAQPAEVWMRALRMMRDERIEHERRQVQAMQRWARRRGRRKGRG